MTWPGEEKGDPLEKENDDSRVGGGGSSLIFHAKGVGSSNKVFCQLPHGAAAGEGTSGQLPFNLTGRL